MKFSKKAMVLILTTAILIMLVIMPMLFWKMGVKKSQFEKSLGKIQIDLLQTYQKAQKDLFYIDQSAKYAAHESVFALADNGGFTVLGSKCGKYQDYNLWNNKVETCYPDYKNNLKAFFGNNLKSFLTAHPSQKLDNTYSFQLIKDEIIAIPKSRINYEFENGNYSIKPSFSVNIDYNIEEYTELIIQSKELIKKCSGKEDLNSCINQHKPQFWITGSDKPESRYFYFTVNSNITIPVYLEESIDYKPITYRFALYFP